MGNCQAVDTASLVIQHPSGKAERLSWPVSASEVMRTNPGHHVALLISSSFSSTAAAVDGPAKCYDGGRGQGGSVRVTRIKLLSPTDTLALGQVYRLVTTQEVMKGLWAKKCAEMRKNHGDFETKAEMVDDKNEFRLENQVRKHERKRHRKTGSNRQSSGKSRQWQPSLQSISESAS